MKVAAGNATKLQAILKKHAAAAPPPPRFGKGEPGDPVAVLLHALLLWESTLEAADRAIARLAERLIDWNELRVCLVDDTEEILGQRYPLARERCVRIRESLNAIYKRHHRVDLSHLAGSGKREARAYLESLPGVPAPVAARVLLASFGGAAMPVDERLRRRLVAAGVVPEELSADAAAAWIVKTVGAERLAEAMHALQAFSDATPEPEAKPAAKKTAERPAAKPKGEAAAAKAPSATTPAKAPAKGASASPAQPREAKIPSKASKASPASSGGGKAKAPVRRGTAR